MEIRYLDMDLDRSCLISVLSTAVISPKMLFDKEPMVLLLCNIDMKASNVDDRFVHIYKDVQSMYRNPERFMIPESLEELEDCLRKIADYIKKDEEIYA